MEALLANYASDEDDEIQEEEAQKTRQQQLQYDPHHQKRPTHQSESETRKLSIFASLPPPKTSGTSLENPSVKAASSDDTRKSLFSSLPPPKLSSVTAFTDSAATENTVRVSAKDATSERRSSLFSALPPPKGAEKDDSGVAADDRYDGSGTHPERRSSLFNSLPPPHEAGNKNFGPSGGDFGTRSSLFSALPPPKEAGKGSVSVSTIASEGRSSFFSSLPPPKDMGKNADVDGNSGLFGTLPPPRKSTSQTAASSGPAKVTARGKRVVEFRPSINMDLLKDDEDDDYLKSKAKRQANEPENSGKATGLAAMLPKPKYSGPSAALGSGFASGGRTALEINNDNSRMSEEPEMGSHDNSSHAMDTSGCYQGGDSAAVGPESYAYGVADSSANVCCGSSEHVGCNHAMDPQSNTNAAYWQESSSGYQYPYQEGSEQYAAGEYYDISVEQYHGMASDAPSYSAPVDPLASILMKERRKGGNYMPPAVIEVKQSELTANRVREDQMRSTGIAFGPMYKSSAAPGKGKPSKLHRRKHQIGTLLYDMKQKEMELIERRSKGMMTKAQTQAKYGW